MTWIRASITAMPDYKREAKRAFSYEGLPVDWQDLIERSRSPQGPDQLYDVAREAGLASGQLLLDAGCRDARHMKDLGSRFGCNVVGVDLVEAGLRKADRPDRAGLVCGDIESLPFEQQTFDFVWCRDVLEMTVDPLIALREFRRVLRPEGGMMLYIAVATEELETRERDRLFEALALSRRGTDESVFDAAIEEAGFSVTAKTHVSPRWLEHALERGDDGLASDALKIARMRTAEDEFVSQLGKEWYERIYAWHLWSVYLLLGKLQTIAWALRASP